MTDDGSTTGAEQPPAPPTDPLYQRDAYLRSFEALEELKPLTTYMRVLGSFPIDPYEK